MKIVEDLLILCMNAEFGTRINPARLQHQDSLKPHIHPWQIIPSKSIAIAHNDMILTWKGVYDGARKIR